MKSGKQKLLIEYLISSEDIYARCIGIIEAKYFDPEYRSVVLFIKKYYDQYKNIPSLDILKAEFDEVELELKDVNAHVLSYVSNEIEDFVRQSAIIDAIQTSFEDIQESNYDNVAQRVLEASQISLERDLGVNLYDDPEENLQKYLDQATPLKTGIASLDDVLEIVRKQLTLFSANSGGGKSIVMANIGALFSKAGLDVLILSLELSEGMIYSRLGSITTYEPIKTQRENIPKIASKLKQIKERGAGSYIIKRMPAGTSANNIRSFLKQYIIKKGKNPDVIIVDYLDKMSPNGGTKNLSISEQDKLKTEQLYEIGVDYNAAIISASQQNREAIRMNAPDQGVIAGGLTKVNEVDNYVSIYMSPEMRLEGIMLWYFLKTRSNDNVGTNHALSFNPVNLVIGELSTDKVKSLQSKIKNFEDKSTSKFYNKNKPEKESSKKEYDNNQTINHVPNLPRDIDDDNEESDDSLVEFMEQLG